ncbi:MAG: hypothetical protein KJP08_06965 [Gammaproteobacteria bacterium]|nr:hypothetical protein [Gammaproteobacteria bacterium]NNF49117.1 hypothetical protein [Woeseiaceae bacterium]MBT8094531.1 hypothetical protein [Gammaproteobacteria bacterium]MBT8104278.1 hypothetical protein [Gammaproteobacteria bacterium]NNK24293.1 hypothetical protein [Woeseiaceae bacterium]
MEIIDIGRKILDAVEAADGVAASKLILELQGAALDLRDENARLREQLAELEAHIDLIDQMRFDGTFYWRGDGEDKRGPYCQKCLDMERRAIQLQHIDETVADYASEWYECLNCQTRYDL